MRIGKQVAVFLIQRGGFFRFSVLHQAAHIGKQLFRKRRRDAYRIVKQSARGNIQLLCKVAQRIQRRRNRPAFHATEHVSRDKAPGKLALRFFLGFAQRLDFGAEFFGCHCLALLFDWFSKYEKCPDA